ncbi:DUF2207 domain-containing protein [Microbacterium sp. SLBN-146]|uniref:DUF2207 domain-containing protein n=1 Tax=Microbacterium sp. SLBN-146 TaxID=2768457 RepID=UPI00114FE113|nr:DUF2207 domain-containing protein [Microbacterium sp. SLBN-146]TQJ30900.1 putative membrane protein DUF2207 [Microbacterium sp. SLBN-146]
MVCGTRALTVRLVAVLLSVFAILLFGPTIGASAASASADVDDFTFESLDVEYELSRAEDGTSTLHVRETFVAVFPEYDQNRGMRRVIPDFYQGAPLHPELLSITDGAGEERASGTDSDEGMFSMTSRADDFVHGRQTYVFEYTLHNVTRYFADTGVDEFYWDVTGTDWRQPFGRTSMRLEVDDALADALTGAASCYVGSQGATDTCEIQEDSGAVVATTGPLAPYETMTVAVAFAAGTFTPFDSSYFASPWGWLQAVAGVGAIGALVSAIVVRRRYLRDDPGRPTIIAEYTPPREVDALESAVLLGLVTKAIPAEVLEQAVVGSIRILEGTPGRWSSRAPLMAELVDPSRADGDGRMLLEGLFPEGRPGEQFEFGRTDTRFSTAAQKILKAANAELDRRGMRRPVSGRVRVWPILAAVLAGGAAFPLGLAALSAGVHAAVPIIVMVAGLLVAITAIGLVSRRPLTSRGAETRDHLAGLKIFIEWAEADRIRMLQSPLGAERVPVDTGDTREMLRLYESLLPYAVVFGQEKEWAEQLAVLYGSDSPGWYSGTSGFTASSFAAGISTLSASTSSSSSTSGGSSGGGSAGGGGGGGGGGGV